MVFVSNNISLSPTTLADAADIVEYMRDKEIHDQTLTIPFPYTLQDAHTWLEDNDIFTSENGHSKNLAIRTETGRLIGVIGLQYNYGTDADKSEMGYWLAKAWWNKGIMTRVIGRFCELAKEEYHLKTLEAHVFAFNLASQQVLLKNGFALQPGIARRHKKDGKQLDAVKLIKLL